MLVLRARLHEPVHPRQIVRIAGLRRRPSRVRPRAFRRRHAPTRPDERRRRTAHHDVRHLPDGLLRRRAGDPVLRKPGARVGRHQQQRRETVTITSPIPLTRPSQRSVIRDPDAAGLRLCLSRLRARRAVLDPDVSDQEGWQGLRGRCRRRQARRGREVGRHPAQAGQRRHQSLHPRGDRWARRGRRDRIGRERAGVEVGVRIRPARRLYLVNWLSSGRGAVHGVRGVREESQVSLLPTS